MVGTAGTSVTAPPSVAAGRVCAGVARPELRRPGPLDGRAGRGASLSRGGVCAWVLFILGLTTQALAQPPTLGAEFQVNSC